MKIHIINQYVWPDGSPVCIYAEQLAISLHVKKYDVVMIGGSGLYRKSNRPEPSFPLIKINTKTENRDTYLQIISEYISVTRQLIKYIRREVRANDVAITTSSPFTNVLLLLFIPRNTLRIMWLSDYYPESLKSLGILFKLMYLPTHWLWQFILARWDHVIKISGNLNYYGANAVVHRFWPTIPISPINELPEKAALYTGNLGITHDADAVIQVARILRKKGFTVRFYADGPKVKQLPNWIEKHPTVANQNQLIDILHRHQIHLVAGTVDSDGGSFPSKTWNSLASGRTVIPCGFTGNMDKEFAIAAKSDYRQHLEQLVKEIETWISERQYA